MKSESKKSIFYKKYLPAFASAIFLGISPIFGKIAILNGISSITVVAMRTIIATVLMFILLFLFNKKYFYIYPAGLLGCLLAGWVNGLGSLFYYQSLEYIDASLGQLLFSFYPFLVVFWMYLDGFKPSKLTIMRLIIIFPSIYLIIGTATQSIDIKGVILMLVGTALYALHLPINQRVLFDLPPQTVTFYTLIAMSSIVVPVFIFSNQPAIPQISFQLISPVIALGIATFLSRLTLFMGVKSIGGIQTSIIGLSELVITLALAKYFLGESLGTLQFLGALLLSLSIFLIIFEKSKPIKRKNTGWFNWISSPPFS